MGITAGQLKSSNMTAAATSADVGTAPDQRRLYDFSDRVAELSPEESPFFVYLNKMSKKPTDDSLFRFLENRSKIDWTEQARIVRPIQNGRPLCVPWWSYPPLCFQLSPQIACYPYAISSCSSADLCLQWSALAASIPSMRDSSLALSVGDLIASASILEIHCLNRSSSGFSDLLICCILPLVD